MISVEEYVYSLNNVLSRIISVLDVDVHTVDFRCTMNFLTVVEVK